jgi:hypothetical protein
VPAAISTAATLPAGTQAPRADSATLAGTLMNDRSPTHQRLQVLGT